MQEDFHILLASMKHFYNGFIAHQRPQGGKVKPLCQRVDGDSGGAITDLHQTKLRIIGAFTHEFCVDGKKRCMLKLVRDFS